MKIYCIRCHIDCEEEYNYRIVQEGALCEACCEAVLPYPEENIPFVAFGWDEEDKGILRQKLKKLTEEENIDGCCCHVCTKEY